VPPMIRRRAVLTAALLAPLAAACTNAAAAAAPPDPWADLDGQLRALTGQGRFSGAVLAVAGDRTLLDAGYGPADRAGGDPITRSTPFCIGSMGKMFTAVAVGQLVEHGALAFDDTLGRYLDGFPPEVADTVTLHQLLTHTSGMGDIFRRDEPVTEAGHTIAALLDGIRTAPLQFAPGTSYSYSNAGFVTLGAVVERAGGQPYADHVREHVFAPAGMPATGVRSYRPADVPGMAHPYALFGPDGRPVEGPPGPDGPPAGAQLRDIATELKGGSPAGGALSTAADMIAFARALTGHVLLGPQLTDTLTTGKVDVPVVTAPAKGGPAKAPLTPPRYGYGFLDQRRNGIRFFGHNGGTPGYEAQLDVYPDTGHAVVVLTNQDATLRPAVQRSEELLTT
jgi:CubicO group peptidase (beta-lactamase class C family)